MNTRQLEILKKLTYDKENTVEKLSKIYQLSIRMIHYEIDSINYFLKKQKLPQIIKKYGGSITILENDVKLLQQYLSTAEITPELNIKDRTNIFILNVLYNKKINTKIYFKEQQLPRSLQVTTIAKSMELLKDFQLELVIYPDKTAEILGEENNIRNYILSLFHLYSNNYSSSIYQILHSMFVMNNQEYIVEFIYQIQDDTKNIITDEAFYTIINYINIMLTRIKKECSIQKVANAFFLSQTLWYEKINKYIIQLGQQYNLDIHEQEIFQLLDYFMGCSSLNHSFSYYDNWVEFNKIIKKIIIEVGNCVHLPLVEDKELFDGLMIHIKPAIHRLKNKINLFNNVYEEVYEIYSDLYDIVCRSLWLLYDIFEINFSKNEIALITIHFQASIDRVQHSLSSQKRVLIVCGMGFGTSMFLIQQLQQLFSVDIVGLAPLHLLQTELCNHEDIDVVISTVPIPDESTHLPCVVVNPFLKKQDINLLELEGIPKKTIPVFQLEEIVSIISKYADILNYHSLVSELTSYFKPYVHTNPTKSNEEIKKYFPIENISYTSVETWQEAIVKSGELLVNTQYIDEKYIFDIIQNIEQLGSYMIDNRVAYPHAKNDNHVYKTGFSLLFLEKPVLFPSNKKVSIVLMIASKDNKEHSNIMIRFSELFYHHEFNHLIPQKDITKIYSYLTSQL